MRAALLGAAVAVGLAALALPSAAHAAPALSYGCSPPVVPTAASCGAWHTTPVTLVWEWDMLAARPAGGNCYPPVFSDDTPSLPVSCKVEDRDGTSSTEQTVFLHIDRTPPNVTGATPGRPPDQNGWWNHAVGFSFSGTDATSGLASCDNVTFAGPGSAVVGTCHDRAGNVGSRVFTVPFDATPPTIGGVTARAGNRSAAVSWTASPDVVLSRVVRRPGVRDAPSSRLYSGKGRRFSDNRAVNGTTYRYTVTVFDQAGNKASASAAARPAVSKGLKPARGVRVAHPPLLTWPSIRGASYYNVQLFRGRHKVITAWPGRPRLKLRRHMRFAAGRATLRPGRYRWYVWPGYGSRAAHRYGAFIGQSSFVFVRR